MKEIWGKLKDKIEWTSTVLSFRFNLDERIKFIPGQFTEIVFDENDRELKHFLSFSSSPAKDYIEFTKRTSKSKFSQRLNQLNIGDKAERFFGY